MSSYVPTHPIESAVYAEKRTEQEANAAKASTHGAAQGVTEQANANLESAKHTASGYVAAAQDKVATATAPSHTGEPTLVEKAQGAATLTTETARQYAADAAASAQGVLNAAQATLVGAKDQTTAAADQLQRDASAKTDAAAAEGHSDVNSAKATSASYVDQAKGVAGSALGTAHTYVTLGKEKVDGFAPDPNTTLGSLGATVGSAVSSALNTTGQYLASAQSQLQPQAESVKPHVEAAAANVTAYAETAQEKAQPHVDAAKANAQPHIGAAKTNVQHNFDSAKTSIGSEEPKTVV